MVLVEMLNYTFFIVGRFSWKVLYIFSACAATGVLFTHLYRLLIRKRNIFSASLPYIWLHAFAASFIIAVLMMIITELSFVLDGSFSSENLTFIGLAGTTVNWMRYTGVWVIIYFMYKILQQNAKINNEKLQIENLAKTTELELLKMQLNPHFLFNALNSIKALVILNPEKSRDAIVQLSELLRFTLQYGKDTFIPLESEIEEVKKYLHLEKLRFEERIRVHYDIDPELYRISVPPAILLTLVENAIKHGVAKNTGVTSITIGAAQSHNNMAIITVVNTGQYTPNAPQGIGLAHITRRLDELYNRKAVFTITSGDDNTVMASLQLPLLP